MYDISKAFDSVSPDIVMVDGTESNIVLEADTSQVGLCKGRDKMFFLKAKEVNRPLERRRK